MINKRTVLPVILLSAAWVAPAVASPHGKGEARPRAPRPPDDEHAPRALLELREQLIQAGKDEARASMSRFRPLCDEQGYPLVGNVIRKAQVYQPSEFCADVRAGRS